MKLKRDKKLRRVLMPKMKPQGGWVKCSNCGETLYSGGHFVPPCMGDPGFFSCKPNFNRHDLI